MKTLQINTAQNVKINFEIADIGRRLLAFVVDNIIKFAYIYIVLEFYSVNYSGRDFWSIEAMDIIIFLPVTFYSLYSEILLNGQTLGKKLLKLKVVTIDGYKPDITDFIMRWFLRLVDFNFFSLVFIYIAALGLQENFGLLFSAFIFGKLVGFITILTTKHNQRIGDLAANTIVISLKDDAKFSQTILMNISDAYVPKYPNVIKLSDNDARIIKELFTQSKIERDYNTLMKLRRKIEEVTGIKSEEEKDYNFINDVLKDYNYYTQDMKY